MNKQWELLAGLAALALLGYVILNKGKQNDYGGSVGKYGPDGTLGALKPGETGFVPGGGDTGGNGATGSWGDAGNTPVQTAGSTQSYKQMIL